MFTQYYSDAERSDEFFFFINNCFFFFLLNNVRLCAAAYVANFQFSLFNWTSGANMNMWNILLMAPARNFIISAALANIIKWLKFVCASGGAHMYVYSYMCIRAIISTAVKNSISIWSCVSAARRQKFSLFICVCGSSILSRVKYQIFFFLCQSRRYIWHKDLLPLRLSWL